MIYIYVLLLFPFYIYSQSCENDTLDNGVFEVYENDKKIGVIYRKNNFQIEKSTSSSQYTIARFKKEKCVFYLKSYEINDDLDTITWSVKYNRIKQNYYSFIGRPAYLGINYSLEGSVLKTSDEINDVDIMKTFNKLRKDIK